MDRFVHGACLKFLKNLTVTGNFGAAGSSAFMKNDFWKKREVFGQIYLKELYLCVVF